MEIKDENLSCFNRLLETISEHWVSFPEQPTNNTFIRHRIILDEHTILSYHKTTRNYIVRFRDNLRIFIPLQWNKKRYIETLKNFGTDVKVIELILNN